VVAVAAVAWHYGFRRIDAHTAELNRLAAEGVVVSRGKTVGLVECSVTDDRGRLIAKATSTCLTLRGEQAEGR
jgi:acyl-coenzyme A thioesterase PaaI-like protein